MKIYFAGSIRGGRDDREIYLKIIDVLSRYGTILTEHIGSKEVTGMGEPLPSNEIYRRDMAWLTEADVVVAEVTNPSLGVGYEIARAEVMGKPTLCLFRPSLDRRLSAMIGGNPAIVKKEYADIEDVDGIVKEFLMKK